MTASPAKAETKSPEAQTPKRSLWKRLLIRLVVLLLLAALGGAGYLYYRSNRLITSEPYQAAINFVKESKIVKDKVGGPLTSVGFLEKLNDGSSVTEEGKTGEARLLFNLISPKGPIQVSGRGNKFDDVWAIKELYVLFPGEKEKVSLETEVEAVTAKDTPKFDPNKQETINKDIKLPDPKEIKIDIPLPPM